MHPRNPYSTPPDFLCLADAYPPLRPHLHSDPNSRWQTIDFKDEEAQRRLTEAIMFRDFGIQLHIPSDRLCPPVPNRMNYVLWIQDIVHAHRAVLKPRSRRIRGIDIGTGATAMYPFLMCKMEEEWEMVGTEIDDTSYECARRNVDANGLEGRIHIQKASAEGKILFPLEERDAIFEFSMCNPPFYGSAEEVAQLAKEKELPPTAVCTGADVEMIYPDGGEAGFVARMVEESEEFQTRCKWYTSMFGKMSSVATIVEMLRQRSITNYAITEFVQGQTRRWAIAWSYTDVHLPDSIARISSVAPGHALASLIPPRNTLMKVLAPSMHTLEDIYTILREVLDIVDGVRVSEHFAASGVEPNGFDGDGGGAENGTNGGEIIFLIEAMENTWSRSARRRKVRENVQNRDGIKRESRSDADAAMTCSVRVAVLPCSKGSRGQSESAEGPHGAGASARTETEAEMGVEGEDKFKSSHFGHALEFQWIFGKDRAMFESFASHVGRKVGVRLEA